MISRKTNPADFVRTAMSGMAIIVRIANITYIHFSQSTLASSTNLERWMNNRILFMLAMDYLIRDITAISLAPFVYLELEHCRHEYRLSAFPGIQGRRRNSRPHRHCPWN